MPQIQVLPAVPTFGNRLAQTLGEAGGVIAEGYAQKKAMSNLQKLLNDYENPPQQVQNSGTLAEQTANAAQGGQAPAPVKKEPLNPVRMLQLQKAAAKAVGEKAADAMVKTMMEKEKLALKKQNEMEKEEREYERKLTEKEQIPFFEEIAKDTVELEDNIQANDQIIDAIFSGNVGPGSLANLGNIAAELGAPPSVLKGLQSVDAKEFSNGLKGLMGHTIKDLFRGTTTQREIDLAEAMQAEIGVKPEANLAAAFATEIGLKFREERLRLYNDLVKEGVPRRKIPEIVNKQLKPFRKELKDQYFEIIEELRNKTIEEIRGQ